MAEATATFKDIPELFEVGQLLDRPVPIERILAGRPRRVTHRSNGESL
jgi:hypothetical protein